ncbi:hypothetical protein GBAR_LOCUS18037 [Geodia barretti]|uniref:Uncharacterized protein n=1 Tax=Geodia barretti TaxID=519541 RepID=A0AA35WWX1_GEOBA|nr:hypothetical protein GBAR_LOCUS18037 [Geodia barretti]
MQNVPVLTKQKSKASTSQSSAGLPLPLDQIALNDRDNPSSNPELPTVSSVPFETISEAENAPLHCTGVHGELKHSVFRKLKSDIDPNDEESCVSPQNLKRDTTKCTTVLSDESQNLTPLETECDEKCSKEEPTECIAEEQSPPRSQKPSARPPLSEVLVEPSLVKFKTGLNPFAKLNPQSASSPVVSHSPAPSLANEPGPSVRKTGLSLKIRKRISCSNIPLLRLSLADLEGASVCDNSGAVVSDSEINETCVAKSCDATKESADLQPTDFSFSLFDDVLDQSSCDVPSKPHDFTTRSHDLFDQSHDSFDELLRQASNSSLRNPNDTNEVTTSDSSLGLRNDITRGSHDLSRHLVLEVVVQEWDGGGGGGRARPELMLRLLDQSTLKESVVHLRDECPTIHLLSLLHTGLQIQDFHKTTHTSTPERTLAPVELSQCLPHTLRYRHLLPTQRRSSLPARLVELSSSSDRDPNPSMYIRSYSGSQSNHWDRNEHASQDTRSLVGANRASPPSSRVVYGCTGDSCTRSSCTSLNNSPRTQKNRLSTSEHAGGRADGDSISRKPLGNEEKNLRQKRLWLPQTHWWTAAVATVTAS